jgi:hypothetical protein
MMWREEKMMPAYEEVCGGKESEKESSTTWSEKRSLSLSNAR